jgi:hypothetical protein
MPEMMKLTTIAVLASMTLGAAQAQAAAPVFDLNCTGRSGQELHFRFDLEQKKWCLGQCQTVGAIDQLSDSTIILRLFNGQGAIDWTITINRYTSAFTAVHEGYGKDPADQGACKPVPFSGFPQRRF